MKTRDFFSRLDHDKMVAAIVEAEKHTSGEIRVFVSHRKVQDAQRAAAHHFLKLEMHKTAHRNAVLIFVAPESQTFFIAGDEAIHARCGEEFWKQVAADMGGYFKKEQFTEGILRAIHTIGNSLAQHFPRQSHSGPASSDSLVEGA